MIRTTIVPNTSNYSVVLDFPKDYVGEEVEIIAFKKQEGLAKEKTKTTMGDFWGVISDETAEELRKEVAESRNGWEERLKKQF